MIEKYFDKKEDGYIIKDMIRKMIVFTKHNIFRDAPFSKLDLIVCRNMFIYVKPEVQQRTIGNFHHLLNDDGCLFLGNSESLGDLEGAFDVLDRKWKIFHKIKSSIQKIMVFIYGITCLTLRRQCKNLLEICAQKSGLQISSNGFF